MICQDLNYKVNDHLTQWGRGIPGLKGNSFTWWNQWPHVPDQGESWSCKALAVVWLCINKHLFAFQPIYIEETSQVLSNIVTLQPHPIIGQIMIILSSYYYFKWNIFPIIILLLALVLLVCYLLVTDSKMITFKIYTLCSFKIIH